MRISVALIGSSLLLALGACFPKLDPKPAEIPTLKSLDEVMHANETIGGHLWGKIGSDAFTDAEWASLKNDGERMAALAERSKNFSRGPVFDKHADSMITNAKALQSAADAKDAKAASSALGEMKKLCKTCHAETR